MVGLAKDLVFSLFVLFKQFYDFIRQREIVKKTFTNNSLTPAVGKAVMGLYA